MPRAMVTVTATLCYSDNNMRSHCAKTDHFCRRQRTKTHNAPSSQEQLHRQLAQDGYQSLLLKDLSNRPPLKKRRVYALQISAQQVSTSDIIFSPITATIVINAKTVP